jgi:hypothetical protein
MELLRHPGDGLPDEVHLLGGESRVTAWCENTGWGLNLVDLDIADRLLAGVFSKSVRALLGDYPASSGGCDEPFITGDGHSYTLRHKFPSGAMLYHHFYNTECRGNRSVTHKKSAGFILRNGNSRYESKISFINVIFDI